MLIFFINSSLLSLILIHFNKVFLFCGKGTYIVLHIFLYLFLIYKVFKLGNMSSYKFKRMDETMLFDFFCKHMQIPHEG